MRVSYKTPAKLNLILRVLGKRPDGFHEIESVFYPAFEVADELHAERGAEGIRFQCEGAISGVPVGEDNLAVRAAKLFFEAVSIRPGVRLRLIKRIPTGAGLGGGSSDAAATLLALNELYGKPLVKEALQQIAATVGSDAPFFLRPEPALVQGRGEKVRPLGPLPVLEERWAAIVFPGFGVSTKWAYGALTRFPPPAPRKPGAAEALAKALQQGKDATCWELFENDFEAPVYEKYPVLFLYKNFFRDRGAKAALMSGSGSAAFAIFDSREEAEAACSAFSAKFGEACWTAISSLRTGAPR
ncbi:MAG: 4-(cytidine 5'-diphospho)-2-C-methyl-D-erythritol kinase [Verrucomicrobia bacterium]|nr:4-(cytidine 5'-diphospho)-2-C-methyl-D-erythritol kinase [Verrucomicrobiota bacterium]